MVRIYTRKGDAGETSLFTGERVAKDEARLEALGAIDELVAFLGLAKASAPNGEVAARLTAIQSELYLILSDIASAGGPAEAAPPRLPHDAVAILESLIDQYEARLPPLREFIVPGGSVSSATLHVARTVCRRAERRVTSVAHEFPVDRHSLAYLNRLSDLIFVLARIADQDAGRADTTFKSVL